MSRVLQIHAPRRYDFQSILEAALDAHSECNASASPPPPTCSILEERIEVVIGSLLGSDYEALYKCLTFVIVSSSKNC